MLVRAVIFLFTIVASVCFYAVGVAVCVWLLQQGHVGMYLAIGLICLLFAVVLHTMREEEY